MSKICSFTFLLLLLAIAGFAQSRQQVHVLSFNIRYDNPGDGINAWPNRKEMAAEVFTAQKVDIAGLQEVLKGQLDDLLALLPEYASVGVGRDDGKEKGEYAPVLYHKERFELLESGTFWLSETPDAAGSKGWDAALPRICTWAKLREQESGKELWVFNTHFDHIGEEARTQSALLILRKIAELAGDEPFVLTGDFNLTPQSEGIQAIMNSKSPEIEDARKITRKAHFGGDNTFNGWGKSDRDAPIDYIFVKKGIPVKKHGYLLIKKGKVYISDHYPVFGVINL